MRTIDLSGKAALITGGTRNIGRVIAQCLAEAGADVALFYRSNEEAATRAREEIRASTGRRAEVYRGDVGDEATVEAGVKQALEEFGAFPIVVHNAMGHRDSTGPPGTMPDVSTVQWRNTLAVNLDAAFFLTRALLRREGAMPPGSSAVFIGSGRGHGAGAGHAAYGTAKAGLVHFAAILAQDVGPRGVRVNVVSPGFIAREGSPEEDKAETIARTALRRLGTPEDVAGAVLFFASDLAAFVTGQWLRVDGGD